MMKRVSHFSMIFALALSLLSVQADAEVMNFTVSPTVAHFETVQGTSKIFELSFYNQGKTPLNIRASVQNLRLDMNGVPQLLKQSDKKQDWANFVVVEPKRFQAMPGVPKKVKVVLKSPRGRTGGGYFAVAFDAAPDEKKKKRRGEQGITLGGQITTLFIGEVPRTGKRKAVIAEAKVLGSEGAFSTEQPLELEVVIANQGTTHLNAEGTVVLRSRDQKKRVVGRFPLRSGSGLIFPGGERRFSGVWEEAWRHQGKRLIAEVRIRYAGGVVQKRYPLTIPSPQGK